MPVCTVLCESNSVELQINLFIIIIITPVHVSTCPAYEASWNTLTNSKKSRYLLKTYYYYNIFTDGLCGPNTCG